ncbi:MAG: hypothetical protein UET87_06000, partial [Oscillospiraceae bacterium]|nr:hypothetical protein [Oscillospiraceae bacterium]
AGGGQAEQGFPDPGSLAFLCAAGKCPEKYGFCRTLMEICRKQRPEGGPRLLKLRKECVKMMLHLSRVWQRAKRIIFI